MRVQRTTDPAETPDPEIPGMKAPEMKTPGTQIPEMKTLDLKRRQKTARPSAGPPLLMSLSRSRTA